MPPNIVEANVNGENNEEENKRINTRDETIEMQPPSTPTPFINSVPSPRVHESTRKALTLSTTNLVANLFIGAIIGIVYMFCFRTTPLQATAQHIVLCVTGYQLLMAQAIMSFAPSNILTSKLNLQLKRRIHLILQLLGSILALTGTFIKIADKSVHFNTTHGVFGLIALIFTTISLVNGCASLYAQELRKILPGNITKLLHVCFGTIAFIAANVTLCIGLDKTLFRLWASTPLANLCITLTAIMALIVIVSPLATFKKKVNGLLRR